MGDDVGLLVTSIFGVLVALAVSLAALYFSAESVVTYAAGM